MCLIQIVIFLFAASLSMMNDGSQGGGVMNGSTLAPLHALLILLLYYSCNPAGCSCPPYTRSTEGGGLLPTVSPPLTCVCVCVNMHCVLAAGGTSGMGREGQFGGEMSFLISGLQAKRL